MPIFIEIYCVLLEKEHAASQTDIVNPLSVNFMQRMHNKSATLMHMYLGHLIQTHC